MRKTAKRSFDTHSTAGSTESRPARDAHYCGSCFAFFTPDGGSCLLGLRHGIVSKSAAACFRWAVCCAYELDRRK